MKQARFLKKRIYSYENRCLLNGTVAVKRLLGHMDLDTREWFDGVLTAAARKVVKEPPEVRDSANV